MSAEFRTLIDAAELARHLGQPSWVIVDCRYSLGDPESGEQHYAASRIPGAAYAHLERDLCGPRTATSGRNPLPGAAAFAQTLARLGIEPETQVAVYDDSFGSIAARLWWMLRWVGHRRVALLDGGWPLWKRLRQEIESGPPPPRTDTPPPYPVRPDAEALVDVGIVDSIRLRGDWCLLDARPEERYSGEREPVDRVAGHIPGSRHWTYEDNLEYDGRFLDAASLHGQFTSILAGVQAQNTIHTCGSGVTACHNLLAMEHAGLSGSRLYPGSWSEWISDPSRPVAVGMDPGTD